MRTTSIILLGAILVVSGGCSKAATSPSATSPVQASLTVAPAPGATAVARTASVMVQFDTAVDSASCVSRFTMRMGDTLGPIVRGRMTWDSTYRHMTFVPDSMLGASTQYTMYMRDSMTTLGPMMGGMGGGQQRGPGSPMMFTGVPTGAMRTSAGMVWAFRTGQ